MSEFLKEENYFRTSELALAAALSSYGFLIEAVDKSQRQAIFLIRREQGLDEIIQRYFSHQLQVECLTYFNRLKELKSRLYHVD